MVLRQVKVLFFNHLVYPYASKPERNGIYLTRVGITKVVMMSHESNAKVGKYQEINLPKSRARKNLLAHSDYFKYRKSLLTFSAKCDKTH